MFAIVSWQESYRSLVKSVIAKMIGVLTGEL